MWVPRSPGGGRARARYVAAVEPPHDSEVVSWWPGRIVALVAFGSRLLFFFKNQRSTMPNQQRAEGKDRAGSPSCWFWISTRTTKLLLCRLLVRGASIISPSINRPRVSVTTKNGKLQLATIQQQDQESCCCCFADFVQQLVVHAPSRVPHRSSEQILLYQESGHNLMTHDTQHIARPLDT